MVSAAEIKTDGEMLEDGEVNEDAARRGFVVQYFLVSLCSSSMKNVSQILTQADWLISKAQNTVSSVHQAHGQADWHADVYAKNSGLLASAQQALCARCYSH